MKARFIIAASVLLWMVIFAAALGLWATFPRPVAKPGGWYLYCTERTPHGCAAWVSLCRDANGCRADDAPTMGN